MMYDAMIKGLAIGATAFFALVAFLILCAVFILIFALLSKVFGKKDN